MDRPSVALVVPGSIESLTGGYGYDRRMVAGLRDRGWSVAVHELDGSFPFPTSAAREDAGLVLASLSAGSMALIDGLALGALPDEIVREARRLRLVALIHHPLAAETGLDRATAARLEDSERRALAAVNHVIVTSRATASALARYRVAPNRISVVEPGTDRAALAAGSNGGLIQLLCVATLIPRKGHDIFFDALAIVSPKNWHLTCVGSLSRHPSTTARLSERLGIDGLADRVDLAGERDAATLSAYYDRSDLFVLPTLHEGYGMAVAEALARGLPIISTAVGAIPELVGGEAGLIVPPGDVKALAVALEQAIGDSELRARLRRGAERVRARLPTWQDAAANMEAALLPVVGASASQDPSGR